MQRVVILGAGESGVGAALLAKQRGFDVFVSDAGAISPKFETELKSGSISYEQNGHTEELVLSADEVIKSPGIPEKASIIQKIRAKNIATTTATTVLS